MVFAKTLDSPMDCKEIQPVHPEGDQSWMFIGRTDAEAEAPILWPPDGKSQLVGKDPNGRLTEGEKVEWHHQCNGHERGQTPGDGEGRGAWRSVIHAAAKGGTRLGD